MATEDSTNQQKRLSLSQQENLGLSEIWNLFLPSFLLVLNPTNPQGVTVHAFISRTLFQFHLQGLYDPAYILHEVYLRALDCIWIKKERIYNPTPWIKSVAYYIIRELNRKETRNDSLDAQEDWEAKYQLLQASEFKINRDYSLITLAYQHLDIEEQRILKLFVVDEFSYRDIRNIYAAQGQDFSDAALRQQKSRALKHLRDIYHSLADQQDCCKDDL